MQLFSVDPNNMTSSIPPSHQFKGAAGGERDGVGRSIGPQEIASGIGLPSEIKSTKDLLAQVVQKPNEYIDQKALP